MQKVYLVNLCKFTLSNIVKSMFVIIKSWVTARIIV